MSFVERAFEWMAEHLRQVFNFISILFAFGILATGKGWIDVGTLVGLSLGLPTFVMILALAYSSSFRVGDTKDEEV